MANRRMTMRKIRETLRLRHEAESSASPPPAHLSEFGGFGSFAKQCRSRFQIPVRVQRIGMAKVGGQSQHMPAWVCYADIHVLQRAHGKVERACETGCRSDDGHGARTCPQRTTTADAFTGQVGCSARCRLTSHHQITAIETTSPAALRTELV